jgi:hypothetical protein
MANAPPKKADISRRVAPAVFVAAPPEPVADPDEVPLAVGVADVAGYADPRGLISNGWEVAKT